MCGEQQGSGCSEHSVFQSPAGHSGEDVRSDVTLGHVGSERDQVSSVNVFTFAICDEPQDFAYRSFGDVNFRGCSGHFWCGEGPTIQEKVV